MSKNEELDGATNVGDYAAWPSSAGEFAARWNARDPEDREARVRRIIEDARTAGNCWQADHAGRIEGLIARAERAEQKSAELAAVIAEALRIVARDRIASANLDAAELADILIAVPSDVLAVYTTRIREESVGKDEA